MPKTTTATSFTPSSNKSATADVLENTCKDWTYSRYRAYKLGREGDQKGSEHNRLAIVSVMNDLRLDFSEKEVADTIGSLEASGYKAGF